MESLRAEVERIAGARALAGLPAQRLAIGSLSDLARVNRVQGLALGAGGMLGVHGRRIQLYPAVSYGTSDHRLLGSLDASWDVGATRLGARAQRRILDFSDLPVIAPLLNSLTSQEAGDDYGDYVLVHALSFSLRRALGVRTWIRGSIGVEESQSVRTQTSPANGSYRPNPPLGGGSHQVGRLELQRGAANIGARGDLEGQLSLEVGHGLGSYVRATAQGTWTARLPTGELRGRLYAGAGSDRLPAYRSFVLGGRGTLVGEPFRAYGGREMALGQLEWRVGVPFPAIALGSFASTGRRLVLAPFVAAGYTARSYDALPWNATSGVRPVAGLALEWLMGILRVEAGVGLRDGRLGVTVDINRDWWGLL
jgi:hypothetical protein